MTQHRRRTRTRRGAAVTGGLAAALVVVAACAAPSAGTEPSAGRAAQAPEVRFEVRLASAEPVEGWTEHSAPDGRWTVWVAPEPELGNADVQQAWYERDGDSHQVGLLLTEEGAIRFARFTTDHVGSQLALMVDGRVVSAPRIAAPITAGRALIRGNLTEAEARAVAAGIVAAE